MLWSEFFRFFANNASVVFCTIVLTSTYFMSSSEQNSSSAPTNTEEVSLEVYSKELRDRSGPWEECLGVSGEECVVMIEEDSPDLAGSIFIVEPDMMVTMDVRYDRVRIYVDDEGMVQQVPQRG